MHGNSFTDELLHDKQAVCWLMCKDVPSRASNDTLVRAAFGRCDVHSRDITLVNEDNSAHTKGSMAGSRHSV